MRKIFNTVLLILSLVILKLDIVSAQSLYGMARDGGANSLGTIFTFNNSTSNITASHSFNGTDGANP